MSIVVIFLGFIFQDRGDDHRVDEQSMNIGVDSYRYNGDRTSPRRRRFYRHQSVDNCFPSIASPLSRCGTRRSNTPTRSSSPFRSMSRDGSSSTGAMRQQSTNSMPSTPSAGLSKSKSGRSSSSSTPIMFSNSSGILKPQPIEKKLECTLEELCYGCKRKIKITRDIVTNTGLVYIFQARLLFLVFFFSLIFDTTHGSKLRGN